MGGGGWGGREFTTARYKGQRLRGAGGLFFFFLFFDKRKQPTNSRAGAAKAELRKKKVLDENRGKASLSKIAWGQSLPSPPLGGGHSSLAGQHCQR